MNTTPTHLLDLFVPSFFTRLASFIPTVGPQNGDPADGSFVKSIGTVTSHRGMRLGIIEVLADQFQYARCYAWVSRCSLLSFSIEGDVVLNVVGGMS